MGKAIGAEWRARLKELGFVPQGTGGRKGTYGSRTVGPVRQAVGVLVDNVHRDGAFNVQLNVNMPLPHADHDVVILLADVSHEEIRIQEPGVHEPGFATWWTPDEIELAWRVFLQLAVPWLERHSRPEGLIAYFEQEYRRLEEARARASKPSIVTRTLRALGMIEKERASVHHQYLLWLSMLYEAQGRLDQALQRLDHYARDIEAKGVKAESERLVHHRESLMRRLYI